jgi:hypothetical protein
MIQIVKVVDGVEKDIPLTETQRQGKSGIVGKLSELWPDHDIKITLTPSPPVFLSLSSETSNISINRIEIYNRECIRLLGAADDNIFLVPVYEKDIGWRVLVHHRLGHHIYSDHVFPLTLQVTTVHPYLSDKFVTRDSYYCPIYLSPQDLNQGKDGYWIILEDAIYLIGFAVADTRARVYRYPFSQSNIEAWATLLPDFKKQDTSTIAATIKSEMPSWIERGVDLNRLAKEVE